MARQGRAGKARPGLAGQGRRGRAGQGKARHGRAGKARPGLAGRGRARHGRNILTSTEGCRMDYNKSAGPEIKRLIKKNNGILTAEMLVKYAKNESSPLHKYFTWDDTEAAKKCRIYEARTLLRVCVEILPNSKSKTYSRVTAHLTSDGEGYRIMTEVLSDKEMSERLLSDALNELEAFRKKYARLKQLSAIFGMIDKLKKIKITDSDGRGNGGRYVLSNW
jgi:hypothetical protein